jgi:hypothetical protein
MDLGIEIFIYLSLVTAGHQPKIKQKNLNNRNLLPLQSNPNL